MLEANLREAEENVADCVREELSNVRTMPPGATLEVDGKHFVDATRPWIIPEDFEQQASLLRYQTDPVAESEHERKMQEQTLKFKNAELELSKYRLDKETSSKKELLAMHLKGKDADKEMLEMQLKNKIDLVKLEHAFELKMTKERKSGVFQKGLVHVSWNKSAPANHTQAINMMLDEIFESSTRKVDCIGVSFFIFSP